MYKELITKLTGCKESEASEVEDIMRNDILHSTLDWVPLEQFRDAAKEAYEMLLYMNSDEGQQYINELKNKINATS